MMTIKEMSELTGVSARALRYYDEIGLFHPNGRSEAGYRLYDEKELEVLRQILYFRELDIPLRTIKEIIENPALDRKSILQTQKKMLISEKERLERLIDSIDVALKGANTMDFTVFNKEESSKMFSAMLEHMPDEIRDTAIKEFGSVEEWRAHYLNAVSSEEVQKQYAKGKLLFEMIVADQGLSILLKPKGDKKTYLIPLYLLIESFVNKTKDERMKLYIRGIEKNTKK